MAARQPTPPDPAQPLTDRTEPMQETDGPTVALVHTHIDGAFHSGVEGAPDPITGQPQPIKAGAVKELRDVAKANGVALTFKNLAAGNEEGN